MRKLYDLWARVAAYPGFRQGMFMCRSLLRAGVTVAAWQGLPFFAQQTGTGALKKNVIFLLTTPPSSSIYIFASGCSAVWERT